MKYNILSVGSKSYFPFVDIFLNSLYQKIDLKKLSKFFLVLNDMEEFSNALLSFDKLEKIYHNSKDDFTGVHSQGWYDNTKLKTFYLHKILSEIPEDESLILIDSDVLILEDFHECVNKDFDIQITQMSDGRHRSHAGPMISHIACFMIFNNIPKSKIFVDKWIKNMDALIRENKGKPHETPAMNLVLLDEQVISDFKIESLDDRIVCGDSIVKPETKILHYKSNKTEKSNPVTNFEYRVLNAKYFDKHKEKLNYKRFLNLKEYIKWKKNILNNIN